MTKQVVVKKTVYDFKTLSGAGFCWESNLGSRAYEAGVLLSLTRILLLIIKAYNRIRTLKVHISLRRNSKSPTHVGPASPHGI